jgi:3-oxoacyl-[acyl-carrier-protein] synthase-3
MVQAMLVATCPAFTITTGCTGFVYSLVVGHQFIANNAFRRILIVGVELISRFLDWTDRNTCVLFGDGAGAIVLTASDQPGGVLAFDLGSDGSKAQHLKMDGGGSANPMSYEVIDQRYNFLRMNGSEVFGL